MYDIEMRGKNNVIYHPPVYLKGNSPSPYAFRSQHTDKKL